MSAEQPLKSSAQFSLRALMLTVTGICVILAVAAMNPWVALAVAGTAVGIWLMWPKCRFSLRERTPFRGAKGDRPIASRDLNHPFIPWARRAFGAILLYFSPWALAFTVVGVPEDMNDVLGAALSLPAWPLMICATPSGLSGFVGAIVAGWSMLLVAITLLSYMLLRANWGKCAIYSALWLGACWVHFLVGFALLYVVFSGASC